MEEAIEDDLEDQEIGSVRTPWRALLRPVLILLLVVGILVVLLCHPGPEE
jgi:hypothetical protein